MCFGICLVLVKNVSAQIQVAYTSDDSFELMKNISYKKKFYETIPGNVS